MTRIFYINADGSVVEFVFAKDKARVRFPVSVFEKINVFFSHISTY